MRQGKRHQYRSVLLLAILTAAGIKTDSREQEKRRDCLIPEGDRSDYAEALGCQTDFDALAARPLDQSIPGALSVRTVIDRFDGDRLYFQNSKRYPVHWKFTRTHLSGGRLPAVADLAHFNQTEYTSPERRFILGVVTYYEGPNEWAFEIAPYDTASAAMITRAFHAVANASFFGGSLKFHPTSQAIAAEARKLGGSVPILSTNELYAGGDYQPLSLGSSVGRLRFLTAQSLKTGDFGSRDIVVLDHAPIDIVPVSAIITAEFQTPLSHINVLSQDRGTPNMGLRNALADPRLRALEDSWVRLDVGPFDFNLTEISRAQADAWWGARKPSIVKTPDLDLGVRELRDVEDILDARLDLKAALNKAIPAFGAKASHYAAMTKIDGVPCSKAFAVPVYYYWQFMEQNGFFAAVAQMLADPDFQSDPTVRDARLRNLRDAMTVATVDAGFARLLLTKLNADYGGLRMRFRSSTNAEDLHGFSGAGLYASASAEKNDPSRTMLSAVRKVWASVWSFRAFEERSYRRIDHLHVGMAILVHSSFFAEEANGVALTANPYERTGLEPGFYINVQLGESSVVQPAAGITTDQLVYMHDMPGQPIIYYSYSNLVPEGKTVLTRKQIHDLGKVLQSIHGFFRAAYGPPPGDPGRWYAMDVEFKFDDRVASGAPPGEIRLWVKQARPHPGWGH
jgi:hypothetical protein